jgi:hypothetical protein
MQDQWKRMRAMLLSRGNSQAVHLTCKEGRKPVFNFGAKEMPSRVTKQSR